jgi:probable HAF family extracellular repeat protein
VGGPDANGDYAAVLWRKENAVPIYLGKLTGGGFGEPLSINNRGQVAGTILPDSGQNWLPALWQDGSLIELAVFDTDPHALGSQINNQGQIVGFSGQNLTDCTTAHSLLWENGAMINLQTQIPADSGWVLQQAYSINDRGQIGGFGLHNGQIRAYLLTPTGGWDGDDDGGQH